MYKYGVMVDDFNDYGITAGTSVLKKQDGTTQYFKDGVLQKETDPAGNQVIRLNVTSSGGQITNSYKVDTASEIQQNRQIEKQQAVINENRRIDESNKRAIEQYKTDLKEYYAQNNEKKPEPAKITPNIYDNSLNLVDPRQNLTRKAPTPKKNFIQKLSDARNKEFTKFQTPTEAKKTIAETEAGTKLTSAGLITFASLGASLGVVAGTGVTSAGLISSSGKDIVKINYSEKAEVLENPEFKEIMLKSRQAEAEAQPGLISRGLYEINEGFGSMAGRSAFVETARSEFISAGASEDQAQELTVLAYRSRQITGFTEGVGQLTVGATSERVGRRLVTSAVQKYGVKKGFTNLLQTTFNPISKAGILEGASSVAIQEKNRLGKINAGDVVAGAGLGGLSAGLISSGIRRSVPFLKQGAYITDLGEFPSDKIADIIEPASRGAGVRTFVPVSTLTSTKTLTNTKTGTDTTIKRTVIKTQPTKPVLIDTKTVPTFSFINTKVKPSVPVNPNVPSVPVNPRPTVPINTPVKPNVPISIKPSVPINPSINTNINPNVPINPNIPVNTYIFNPRLAPIPPFLPRGAVSSSKKAFKNFFKQPLRYTPTLTSAVFNIKAKKGKKARRDISGLTIRPII